MTYVPARQDTVDDQINPFVYQPKQIIKDDWALDMDPTKATDRELRAGAFAIMSEKFGILDHDGRTFSGKEHQALTGADYYAKARKAFESGTLPYTDDWIAFRQAEEAGDRAAMRKIAKENYRGESVGDDLGAFVDKVGSGFADPTDLNGLFAGLDSIRDALSPEDAAALDAAKKESEDRWNEKEPLIKWEEMEDDEAPYVRSSSAFGGGRDWRSEERKAKDNALRDRVAGVYKKYHDTLAAEQRIAKYEKQLLDDNLFAQIARIKNVVSDDARKVLEMAQDAMDNPTSKPVLDAFQKLSTVDQRAIAGALQSLHYGRDTTLLGDCFRSFWDTTRQTVGGALRSAADSVRQSFMDEKDYREYVERRSLLESVNRERMKEWGYLGQSVIGAFSTIPYMAAASVPYAGTAIVMASAADQFQTEAALNGVDIGSREFAIDKWLFAGAYAAVEKAQLLPFKPIGAFSRRQAYADMFGSLRNVLMVSGSIVGNTLGETVEEGVQGGVERVVESWGIPRDIARDFAAGFAQDFVDSFGTMALVGTAAAGRQAYRYRNGAIGLDKTEQLGAMAQARDTANAMEGHPDTTPQPLARFGRVWGRLAGQWLQGGNDKDARIAIIEKWGFTHEQAFEMDVFLQTMWKGASGSEELKKAFVGGNKILSAAELAAKTLKTDVRREDDGSLSVLHRVGKRALKLRFRPDDTISSAVDPETNDEGMIMSIVERLNRDDRAAGKTGDLTLEGWKALTPEQRAARVKDLRVNGNIVFESEDGATVGADALSILSGRVILTDDAMPQTVFHETMHGVLRILRDQAETDPEAKALQDALAKIAPAQNEKEAVNEEEFGDLFQQFLTGRVSVVEGTDWLSVFQRWVARLLGDGEAAVSDLLNKQNEVGRLFNLALTGDITPAMRKEEAARPEETSKPEEPGPSPAPSPAPSAARERLAALEAELAATPEGEVARRQRLENRIAAARRKVERENAAAGRYQITTAPSPAELAEAARQYDEVVARYTNQDGTRKPGWMKAPNGADTHLTERQWVQVRTPAFKAWFGDWENDPANASKVVDENGEPLVVWHGSAWNPLAEEPGRAVFQHGKVHNTSEGEGFYFTPDKSLAEGWGEAYGYFLNIRGPSYAYDKLGLLSENEFYDIVEREDLSPDEIETSISEARTKRAKEKMREVLGVLRKKGYSFYDEVERDYIGTIEEPSTVEGLLDSASVLSGFVDGHFDTEQFQTDLRNAEAKVFGIDGYFSPGYGNNSGAYVAFTPSQVKSATDNAGTFSGERGDVRYSISGIYTGTAADYDKPSLHYVGTGEGSQVYGWGLYGSNVRGVAEGYAAQSETNPEILDQQNRSAFDPTGDAVADEARKFLAIMYLAGADSVDKAVDMAVSRLRDAKKQAQADWLQEHRSEFRIGRRRNAIIYEQTFFTNRATPEETERHLLKWFEPVSDEQLEWIAARLSDETTPLFDGDGRNEAAERIVEDLESVLRTDADFYQRTGSMRPVVIGGQLYHDLTLALGGEKQASEFLARAGIDGVKYPVDSYGGKTVKDGNVAGWNYVSFRDDNIRVDHKWVDGAQRYQIAGASGAEALGIRNLADAEAMERSGADRTAIWRETGWWRGKDGEWRVEIPDFELSENLNGSKEDLAEERKLSDREFNLMLAIRDANKDFEDFHFRRVAERLNVPDDADPATLDILRRRGVPFRTYKAGDKADRLRALNEAATAQKARFSLSSSDVTTFRLMDEAAAAAGQAARASISWNGPTYSHRSFATAYAARDRILGIQRPDEDYQKLLAALGVEGLPVEELLAEADKVGREGAREDAREIAQLAGVAERRSFQKTVERMLRGSLHLGADVGAGARRAYEVYLAHVRRTAKGRDYDDFCMDLGMDPAALALSIEEAVFDPDNPAATNPAEPPTASQPGMDDDLAALLDGKAEDFGLTEDQLRERVNKRFEERTSEIKERLERLRGRLDEWRRKEAKRQERLAKRQQEQGKTDLDDDQMFDENEEETEVGAKALEDYESECVEEMPDFKAFLEECRREGLDLSNAAEFVAAVRLWVEDFIARETGSNDPAAALRDPVALARYRATMMRFLHGLADSMLDPEDGAAAKIAERMMQEIPSDATVAEIDSRARTIVGFIQRNGIRQTRKQLIRELRKGIKLEAIRGKKWDEMERDAGRKVTGEREAAARYLYRILTWSDGMIAKESARLHDIVAGREDAYRSAGADDAALKDLARTDREVHRAAEKLQALQMYGGLRKKSPAEIKLAARAIMSWLTEEREAHEKRWNDWHARLDALAQRAAKAASASAQDYTPEDPGYVGKLADELTATIRQRLEQLFVGGGADARAVIDEVMRLVYTGSERMRAETAAARRRTDEMLERCVQGTGRNVRQFLKDLDAPIPDELNRQLRTAEQPVRMTNGQALQLLASLEQVASYAGNIEANGRGAERVVGTDPDGNPITEPQTPHAELLRRYFADKPAMVRLLEGMREVYEERRGALSDTFRAVTGNPILAPDPLYAPVKMFRGSSEGFETQVRAWDPFGPALQPRVKNTLDFDLSASIMDVYNNRTRETCRAIAWGIPGMELRSVLCRKEVQDAIARTHGKFPLRQLVAHLTDLVSDGWADEPSGFKWLAQKLGGATTYSALSWNVVTALKQTASIPAWTALMDGGYAEVFRNIANFDRAAARELMDAPGFAARYGADSFAQMFKDAIRDPNANPLQRFFQAGMTAVQMGDFVPGILVGTGVYKAKKLALMRQGLEERQAREEAARIAWGLIEECQQSSRLENSPAFLRRGGFLARQAAKFASSPLLQVSHEWHTLRMWAAEARIEAERAGRGGNLASQMWAADGDDAKRWRRRFVNQVICNHVLMPAAMYSIATVFNLALGSEPPDEEEVLGDLVMQMLSGPFSRIFLIGMVFDKGGEAVARMMGGKPNVYDSTGLASQQYLQKVFGQIGRIGGDVADADWESVRDDFLKMIGQVSAPARYAIKAGQNIADYDPAKARRERKAELRKAD